MKIRPLHSNNPSVKCSIHLNGRLTYSIGAQNELDLEYDHSIILGQNAEDPADKTLYMSVYSGDKQDALRMKSSGAYLYLNTRTLFKRLGYDFRNKIISFDIVYVGNIEGGKLYRLEKWETTRDTASPRH